MWLRTGKEMIAYGSVLSRIVVKLRIRSTLTFQIQLNLTSLHKIYTRKEGEFTIDGFFFVLTFARAGHSSWEDLGFNNGSE
ncbi:hypothetical protein ACET3Z_021886 [Daucus carota]